MKFKIEEKVRYVKHIPHTTKIEKGIKIGYVGTIYDIDPTWEYPYWVIFEIKNDYVKIGFKEEELGRAIDNDYIFDKLFKNI